MHVARGRDLVEMDGPELERTLVSYDRLVLDVGTGDGRFAYALAKRHPDRLVIGMDPAREQMRELSSRALRKPARGGVPNVLYVVASAEAPPAELLGRADEVHVVLPWARLMVGLVLAQADVLAGLRALARPGAALELTLGADVWADPVPIEARDLPELTLDYVRETLAPAYAAAGVPIVEARMLSPEEIAAIPSSWARRLAHGRRSPRFVRLRAENCSP